MNLFVRYGVMAQDGLPAGTKVLMHMDDDVVDATGLHSPAVTGTVSYGTGKFGKAVSASTASSCVKIPYTAGGDLTLGTADWRIECWAYLNAYWGIGGTSVPRLFSHQRYYSSSYKYFGTMIYINPPSHVVGFTAQTSATGWVQHESTITPSLQVWHHYEMSRSGSTIYCFIDGTLSGTINIGVNAVWQDPDTSWKICSGADETADTDNPASVLNGMVDEFLIAVGSPGHTSAFTPPTKPYA